LQFPQRLISISIKRSLPKRAHVHLRAMLSPFYGGVGGWRGDRAHAVPKVFRTPKSEKSRWTWKTTAIRVLIMVWPEREPQHRRKGEVFLHSLGKDIPWLRKK